ncbi:SDR family oxidoreductase [Helicobacter sp. 11S02596-1]|uniref:SDR family NAD(P)-dependent oxidoreductase n=1 Tax=Helicobacter sp. 11S02596-1 TaxID=1476194 RepID=UPI000BA596D4|nr:SDR family oxidoreductase [Helicobacter sp. 11S02596-1]PAF45177.1 oxidoreductase [Helicobacter sp. 11S02596-1]
MKKVFVITGSRKGIGKELAWHYLQEGHIVCGCSRAQGDITHPNYRHFALDVSDENAVIAMVKAVKKEFGQIDVLLNNAGIASMNHLLLTPFKSVQNIFSTNVFGSFLFIRECAKIMSATYLKNKKHRPHPHYRIVNFATVATALRLEGEAIYAASKAAIINLTEIAAKELAPFGITINALAPTPVPTDLIKNVPKEKMDALLASQALKRFGSFEDVVNVIEFFINEKSDFITGQTLFLGGVNA